MQKLGITANTPDPEGGKKSAGFPDGNPNGYLEEAAFTNMGSRIPRDQSEGLKNLQRAQEVYFSQGITTIHEGLTRQPEWDLLQAAASQGLLRGDVAAYIDIKDSAALLEEHRDFLGHYRNRLKIARVQAVFGRFAPRPHRLDDPALFGRGAGLPGISRLSRSRGAGLFGKVPAGTGTDRHPLQRGRGSGTASPLL